MAGFLTTNQGQFEIGAEPVEAYLARTGLTGTPAAVITEVKRLQRAYQLTPDDASLGVLLRHNLDSAFAVTRYDAAGFTRAFASQLGGPDTAAAIHARARQIFAATLSVTVAYLGGRVPRPRRAGPGPVRLSAAAAATGRRRRPHRPPRRPTRSSPPPRSRTSSGPSTTATARTAARSSARPPIWSTC